MVEVSTQYINEEIPLSSINILPQIRRTFDPESLQNLADDIAHRKRLINPLVVACLDPKSCEQYLEYMKGFRQVPHEVADLVISKRPEGDFYYILIDGERRVRAIKIAFPDEPDRLVEARLHLNIPPDEAVETQSAANLHRPVEVKEEASDYVALFKMRRQRDPGYSKAEFARSIGRSVSSVNNALKFCDLPADIQQAVEQGNMPFGCAIGLSSLQERKLSDDELRRWTIKWMIGNYKVPSFCKLIQDYCLNLDAGQQDLFLETQRAQIEHQSKKLVVARDTLDALYSKLGYLQRLLGLFESGILNNEYSPYSTQSPVEIYCRILEYEKLLLPHLRKIKKGNSRRAQEIQESWGVIQETKAVLVSG